MRTRRVIAINCSLCSQPSVAICVACERHYCRKDFDEHRERFENFIIDARQKPDVLIQCLNEYEQVEINLRNKIHEWERKSTDEIHRVATKTSNELDQLIQQYRAECKEDSIIVLNDTRKTRDMQVIEIEKLQNDYGNFLRNIKLHSNNQREPVLEIKIVNSNNEDTYIHNQSVEADQFVSQTVLGKRLSQEPLATNPIGSYWAIGGSDTHLLVQQYEGNKLIMFDRNGQQTSSMTWHYSDVIRDIQWHQRSSRFFILLDKKLIVFDPHTKFIQEIDQVTPYQSNHFRRCTCFDNCIFISYWNVESTVEFYEINTWKFQQRWLSPITCRANEFISCIRMNSIEQLAITIQDVNNPTNQQFRFEIRDLTFNILASIQLQTDAGIFSRMTLLSDGCWALANVDNCYIYIMNKVGEYIEKINCQGNELHNIAMISKDIVVIRTFDKLLFYDMNFIDEH